MEIDWVGLEDLYEDIRSDVSFAHLRVGKNRLVPGEGNSPIAMLIGEAPGATEAMQLRPFVGKSGIMLRRLMHIAGLSTGEWYSPMGFRRDANCWLTNVIKYRPPRNRTPDVKEIRDARPYLKREWELIGYPDIIICVGSPALKAVYPNIDGILANAGDPFTNTNNNRNPEIITIWPMIHPGYALRNKDIRPTVEQHWERLGEQLMNHPRRLL